jgi:uncharacterized protein
MSYFKTPGVYIKEQDAFGSSVVAVPTAIPAFIGYTQIHEQGGNSLLMKPTKVRSLAEFREIFGAGPRTTFKVGADGSLTLDEKTRYMLTATLFPSVRTAMTSIPRRWVRPSAFSPRRMSPR